MSAAKGSRQESYQPAADAEAPPASSVGWWCVEEHEEAVAELFERSLDEVASGWATMCAFALSRADETRVLMARLQPEYR
jgi:hypothetical protein